MTTKINNEHKKVYVPNKREQNQTCLDSAEREVHSPKGNVPNLRFPEFQGEWEKCTFDKIAQYKKGPFGSALKKDIFVPQSEDTIKVYEQQNAIKKDWTLSRYYITKDYFNSHMKQFVAKAGDLIVSCAGTIGEIYELPQDAEEGVFNQALMRVQVNDEAVNKEIFITVFSSMIDKFSKIYSNGSAIKNIPPFADLKKTQIFLPCKEEQKKIAKLLALLDERIATQNKIIDKLQSLIKGIMVELQNQGVNKGTWKKVFLSDVLTERNERNTNLFQVFSVSVSQGVVNQVDYLGRSFAAKDTSKYNVVHYGDLVYTKSPTGSFPYGIVKQSLILENVAVSPLYGVYKPKSIAVGAYLHEYFMSEINTHNYLHPLIQKGAKNTINITNQRFLENCVLLSTNINELLQISRLLRSLNNKIKYQQDILQQYQKQKQYLLRQMFI